MLVRAAFLTFVLLALPAASARASEEAPSVAVPLAGPLFHPEGPGSLRWRAGLGTLVDLFPKRTVNAQQYDTPQVTIAGRLGLPLGFSVDLRARTLLVSTQGALGVAWSHAFGRLTLGILDHQGFAYTTFQEDAATAATWALVNEPGLSAGVSFDRVHVSLTGEAFVVFDQHTKAQTGPQIARRGSRVGGTGLTLVAEDVFDWGLVYLGAGWMRTSADYLSWFPYYDPRARVSYLRLVAGYAF